jgi:hypothetical protein
MKRTAAPISAVATGAGSAETVIATVPVPVLGDNPLVTGVTIDAVLNIAPGATTTAVVVRFRRGTTVGGAQIGASQTHTLAAGASAGIAAGAYDSAPGSGGSYCVTVQQTGGSGAGTVNGVITATAA